MSFEKLYNKLINHETYLKQEKSKTRATIITQFNKNSKGRDNQNNKNFNKVSNKILLGHMSNTQNYHLPLQHQLSNYVGKFNTNNFENNLNNNYYNY